MDFTGSRQPVLDPVQEERAGKKSTPGKKNTSEEERRNLNRNNSMRFFFLPLTAWIQLV